MNSKRARAIFAVAVFSYLIAVLQRTSIGVAGVDAAERFDSSAALLSSLAVVQLLVYAALQIPIGVLIDRLGSKILILSGTALMATGQTMLAFAPDVSLAIAGRVFVGAGDAAIFISVIRLVSTWFESRKVPLLSQWVGNIGQFGQVLSAVPFAFVLHEFGWTSAFVSAAACSVLALILVAVVLKDRPAKHQVHTEPVRVVDVVKSLGPTVRRPGTQLGFWSHYVTQSSSTTFSLFWGFPFMVSAMGLAPAVASSYLVLIVITGVVCGPLLGVLSARYPLRRSNLVLGITFALGITWSAVLLWPGVPPLWLLAILCITMGIGGPGSLIGFDFARRFNPQRSWGSANGIVNVGGFFASFTMMFLIGLILDALHNAGITSALYSLEGFRIAFSVQYLVIGVGVVFVFITRGRARKRLVDEEGIYVGPLWVALVRAWKKRP